MPRVKKPDSYISGAVHCQGCGEGHRKDDMLSLCLFCVQAKFIPRQDWLTIGFQDRKSYEQWWNHAKRFKVQELKKIIKKLKAAEAMKQKWINDNVVSAFEQDIADNKAFDEYLQIGKGEENIEQIYLEQGAITK